MASGTEMRGHLEIAQGAIAFFQSLLVLGVLSGWKKAIATGDLGTRKKLGHPPETFSSCQPSTKKGDRGISPRELPRSSQTNSNTKKATGIRLPWRKNQKNIGASACEAELEVPK